MSEIKCIEQNFIINLIGQNYIDIDTEKYTSICSNS